MSAPRPNTDAFFRRLCQLTEAHASGDPRSFRQLYKDLQPRLFRYVFRLVRDRQLAEDLVQQVFLKAHTASKSSPRPPLRDALEHASTLDRGRAVHGWYLTIARNTVIDHFRQYQRDSRWKPGFTADRELMRVLELCGPARQEAELIASEQRAQIKGRIRGAVARLSPGQREVVELHRFHGLPMAEIARRKRVKEGTIRVRAHRAYSALAKDLGPSMRGRTQAPMSAASAAQTGELQRSRSAATAASSSSRWNGLDKCATG